MNIGPSQSSHGFHRQGIRIKIAAAFFLALGIVLYLGFFTTRGASPRQPIQFNHQTHVEIETCDTCHTYYLTRKVAGRPKLAICLDCHDEPQSESPEEEKFFRIAETEKVLRWVKLTRLPRHVRFSHRMHVVVGKVECESCHGDIGNMVAPPEAPLIDITMNFCIDCHRSEGVQLTHRALRFLQKEDLAEELKETLSRIVNKRFQSKDHFMAAVAQDGPDSISVSDRSFILAQVTPTKRVTTDCIACHL